MPAGNASARPRWLGRRSSTVATVAPAVQRAEPCFERGARPRARDRTAWSRDRCSRTQRPARAPNSSYVRRRCAGPVTGRRPAAIAKAESRLPAPEELRPAPGYLRQSLAQATVAIQLPASETPPGRSEPMQRPVAALPVTLREPPRSPPAHRQPPPSQDPPPAAAARYESRTRSRSRTASRWRRRRGRRAAPVAASAREQKRDDHRERSKGSSAGKEGPAPRSSRRLRQPSTAGIGPGPCLQLSAASIPVAPEAAAPPIPAAVRRR